MHQEKEVKEIVLQNDVVQKWLDGKDPKENNLYKR